MADVFDTDHDYQVFATLSEYRLAVDVVIASAQRDLHVFDTDLFDIAFDDLARYELLRNYLARGAVSRLWIVLQDVQYLQQRAARMQRLMRDFSHQIQIRQVAETRETDAFIYSDAGVCLYRPQHEHAKSILTHRDPARCRLFAGRFALMFDAAEQPVSATTLGL